MAFFELNSEITIGKFRFSGVHEVSIRRSMYGVVDTAVIKIPSIGRIIVNGNPDAEQIITGAQFNDGDPVLIKLGYNGDLRTEFQGFVKRRNLNMPLEVACEGYSWLLRRTIITKFEQSATIKELMGFIVSAADSNYPITLQCDLDMDLANITINQKSALDVIDSLATYTDNCLTCFFIQPDVLWCGLVYTASANGEDVFNLGTVNYQLGYNVAKNNSLKARVPENGPVQITYNKRLPDGNKIKAVSTVFPGYTQARSRLLNHLNDNTALQQLADEKAWQLNYTGYDGGINAFLQPYACPGYKANIVDDRYPDRNGIYIIEGTEVTFGMNGARRIVEIGPKVGT